MSVTETERRLTDALEARAAQVSPLKLRPAMPLPSRRPARRRVGPLVGLAAVLVAIACLVMVAQLRSKPPASVRPAAPPTRTPVTSTQRPAPMPEASRTAASAPTASDPSPLASPANTVPDAAATTAPDTAEATVPVSPTVGRR
jgi:hypothetical protein